MEPRKKSNGFKKMVNHLFASATLQHKEIPFESPPVATN